MQYKDYYQILGVTRKSTDAEIKSAYRKLARKFHPDVNKTKDAEQKFKDINEAYEVLSDKAKRSRYDSLGANWQGGSDYTPPPGFDNYNFNFNQGGAQGSRQSFGFDDLGGFSDFFSSLFGDMATGSAKQTSSKSGRGKTFYEDYGFSQSQPQGKTKTSAQEQNLDVTQNLTITAKDLFDRKPLLVRYKIMEKCPSCQGTKGFCPNCGGTGIASEQKSVNVKLPLEVTDGQKIRLKGEGKTGSRGQKGDLFLKIVIKDKDYTVDGVNLTKDVEISPAQAALGCQKDISTLHGNIGIKIPAGTSSGQALRLKGLGLPTKTAGFGDLNARIKIVVPKSLSKTQQDLYKKLAELD